MRTTGSPAEEARFQRGGMELFFRRRAARGQPRARVVSVHGFGEHGDLPNYRMLGEALSERGIEVWQLDLRGHGRSQGQRGHVDRWEEFREDLRELVKRAQGEAPLHLCGLSMGGLMVLDFALEYPDGLKSVVSAVPPIGRVGVPGWMQGLGRVVSKWWPKFSLDSSLKMENISRDIALREEYAHDPLFHLRGSARLLTEMLATAARVREGGARFQVPVLMLLGGADHICPRDDRFYDAVPVRRKAIRMYEGARHNLFLETNRDEVYADVANWVLGGEL